LLEINFIANKNYLQHFLFAILLQIIISERKIVGNNILLEIFFFEILSDNFCFERGIICDFLFILF